MKSDFNDRFRSTYGDTRSDQPISSFWAKVRETCTRQFQQIQTRWNSNKTQWSTRLYLLGIGLFMTLLVSFVIFIGGLVTLVLLGLWLIHQVFRLFWGDRNPRGMSVTRYYKY